MYHMQRSFADWTAALRASHVPSGDAALATAQTLHGISRQSRSTTNDGQNFQIKLPAGDKTHPTFHVLKLKQYVAEASD
ncbi:hypothetical protein CROQUDRAFT_98532 [Cronartium quercuum f. sp. fusiforme G11]|uniref:Uncharacterized protein n=1 Tax=Cronartium quercuum f. sp. fusiforme G11 TaxID=708437 RepID=A0A9P6T8L1_9BASI|nr:hypothetical protein CROQUDRAFT_98532 [Cronartium quercuum f. sp. fusiforme G11]